MGTNVIHSILLVYCSVRNQWSVCWNGSSGCCSHHWQESPREQQTAALLPKTNFRVTINGRHCWILLHTRHLLPKHVIQGDAMNHIDLIYEVKARMAVVRLPMYRDTTATPATTKVGTPLHPSLLFKFLLWLLIISPYEDPIVFIVVLKHFLTKYLSSMYIFV